MSYTKFTFTYWSNWCTPFVEFYLLNGSVRVQNEDIVEGRDDVISPMPGIPPAGFGLSIFICQSKWRTDSLFNTRGRFRARSPTCRCCPDSLYCCSIDLWGACWFPLSLYGSHLHWYLEIWNDSMYYWNDKCYVSS